IAKEISHARSKGLGNHDGFSVMLVEYLPFMLRNLSMIEIHHLRKEYDDSVALENLHLEIPAGEVYGLIGPNGAGKTTLIRILATLMEPTYGFVRIGGIDALEEPLKVHPLIGYMSDVF